MSKIAVRVLYVTLVKCHVQTVDRLISFSHFHVLLMEAGIWSRSRSWLLVLTRSFEDAHHSDKTEKCVSHISHAVSSWTTGGKKAKKPFKGAIAVNSNTGENPGRI